MILVTGGGGFIGSNLVRALNARGHRNLIVADDRPEGRDAPNLAGCAIAEYVAKDELLERVERFSRGSSERLEAVFHLGACAVTTEHDRGFMMRNNFDYSVRLLEAVRRGSDCAFVYASSAAVYGLSRGFREEPACEAPLNVYAESKLLFDEHVRRLGRSAGRIVGLRYFNVYGPRESHKGAMASVAFHLDGQLRETGRVRLFGASHGYGDGEQRRDFVHVEDAVAVTLWAREAEVSGIYNVGTGASRSFNDVARAVLAFHGRGAIEYIPFPESLRDRYQAWTEADLTRLRAAGCAHEFRDLETGVASYMAWLAAGRG